MSRRIGLRIPMIIISTLFAAFMLILPLGTIIVNSLSRGWDFYVEALQTSYVQSALGLSIFVMVLVVIVNTVFGLAASWLLTKYSFKGRKVLAALIDIPFSISPVIAGLAFLMMFGRMGWAAPLVDAVNDVTGWDIRIVFAVPGVVLATIFVTFPLVAREIIPVLNFAGRDQEEAAALMGAKGFIIFRRITLPNMKWALVYGIVLCSARALGEFGAVNALSKTRGKTYTLPLEIDALYLSGSSDSLVAAYAVSSILVVLAVMILVVRSIVEYRMGHIEALEKKRAEGVTDVR